MKILSIMFGPLVLIGLLCVPLIPVLNKKVSAKSAKMRILSQVAVFSAVFLGFVIFQVNGITARAASTSAAAGTLAQGLGYIAAALATGCSCIGAGFAVASAAPAAIGAVSENGDNFGKAMIFVALAEGVAIYGLLISVLIITAL